MTEHRDLSELLGSVPPPPAHRCLDAGTIAALANGHLAEPARTATLEAVARCPDCALALKVALALRPAAAPASTRHDDHPVRPLPRRRTHRWGWPIALAASLLLAIGLAQRQPPMGAEDVVRGTAAATALEPADGAALATAPRVLRWECRSGVRATVQLRDSTGAVRWTSSTRECAASLGDTVLARGGWLWVVHDDAGALLAGPFRFQIE